MVGCCILATAFASTFLSLVSTLGGFERSLAILAFSFLAVEFIALTLFDVVFVLVVTTFATESTRDGAPEVIVMVHCLLILSVLLPFLVQHASTAMVAVRGMTRPPVLIDRSAAEDLG